METSQLSKKIRGNAAVSYWLIGISLAFLWSKNPSLNHPFIKKHVKIAASLHIILLWFLILMSFSLWESIKIWNISLNDAITFWLWSLLFWSIIYGAYKAFHGESYSFGDIFDTLWGGHTLLLSEKKQSQSEQDIALITLSHIPFLGFTLVSQESQRDDLRDIGLFNLIVTLILILLLILGWKNLALFLFLLYIFWVVFVSIQLITSYELLKLNLSFIPTPREKYILLKTSYFYLKNMVYKKDFQPWVSIQTKLSENLQKNEIQRREELSWLKVFPFSPLILSVPVINFWGLFFLKTQMRDHILKGIVLSIIFIIILLVMWTQSPYILLGLIPFFYHLWEREKLGSHMPYVSDMCIISGHIFYFLKKIFSKTRELQKKKVSGSFKSDGKNIIFEDNEQKTQD